MLTSQPCLLSVLITFLLLAAVAPNTSVTVVCTRPGPNFPAAFTVNFTASAGEGACAASSTASITVTTTCSHTGPAFARSNNTAGSVCLGCGGNSTRQSGYGFLNNITKNGTVAAIHALVVGNCSTYGVVGNVSIRCVNINSASANVTIWPAATGAIATSTYFWVGCGPAPSSANICLPASNFGASKCNSTQVQAACGASLTAGGPSSVRLSCTCAAARLVVAAVPAGSATFSPARVGGLCPPV